MTGNDSAPQPQPGEVLEIPAKDLYYMVYRQYLEDHERAIRRERRIHLLEMLIFALNAVGWVILLLNVRAR